MEVLEHFTKHKHMHIIYSPPLQNDKAYTGL